MAEPDLRVELDRTADDVLRLAGELDMACAGYLRQVGESLLRRPHCTRLVLDLSELTFCDAAGLGAMVGLRNRARALGRQLVLQGVPARLRRLVGVAGLAHLLEPDG